MQSKNQQPQEEPEAVYVNMESGEQQQPAFSYYIVPVEPAKRRQCGCGCCCVSALIVFLLLFFLLPRSPSVWLKVLSFNDDDSSAVGVFGFENNDYYSVEWSNAEIDMYWIPYPETIVAQGCVPNVNECESDIYYAGMCAIKVGSFEKGNSFTTKAKSSTEQSFEMVEKSAQEQVCVANMIASSTNVGFGSSRMVARGHVSNKGQGKVAVRDSFYYFSTTS